MGRTVWIFGDQLSARHGALRQADKRSDVVLLIESRRAASRLPYHRHRLILIFAAMRHFADELRAAGWRVDYHTVRDTSDWESALQRHVREHQPEEIVAGHAHNFAEREAVKRLGERHGWKIHCVDAGLFLLREGEFAEWAAGRKRLLMESHYRRMRRAMGVLLDAGGEPVGGRWNFDARNRKTFSDWDKRGRPLPPDPPWVRPDKVTRGVMRDVDELFPRAAGRSDDFRLPTTRRRSLEWLDDFLEHRLPFFGDFQDTMVADAPWMFHSLLSPMMNIGLLGADECVRGALRVFEEGGAPLPAVEGFIRQIIGWREFVNGVYWLRAPGYDRGNALAADRPLPGFFHDGGTDMRCLRLVLRETRAAGWNHHIQRLMVLGNFLLLAGVTPREALAWYSAMFVDAHDWVMAANVLGMALHADGGFMATKPYAASGAYISRMSDYCAGCRYDPRKKSGPDACPFNLLYWDFMDRHAERFAENPRMGMIVRSWRRRSAADREAILLGAQRFLESLP